MTTLSAVFAIVRFQVVWLVFVIGAANGLWWPGVAGAAVLLAIQLAYAHNPRKELLFFALAIVIAAAAELVFYTTDALIYSAYWPNELFAPIWIFGLWLAFATAIPATISLLATHAAFKSALLGLIFGPVAYYGAAQYRTITIGEPFWVKLAVIGIAWALVFPAMIKSYELLIGSDNQTRLTRT